MKSARKGLVFVVVVLLVSSTVGPLPLVHSGPHVSISVTTEDDEFADPGPGAGCSLREAIQAANSDSAYGGCTAGNGDDVIELPDGTYTLALAGPGEDLNATGDLDINSTITINGGGQTTTTIDAAHLDRVLDIHSGTVVINNLTITGGQAPHGPEGAAGAGVGADGLDGGNGAHGGGIRNTGTLTLNGCTVSDNKAGNGGWGGSGQAGSTSTTPGTAGGKGGNGGDGGDGGRGGGIYSTGALTLTDCSLEGNQAGEGGVGGFGQKGGKGADGDAGTPPGAQGGSGGRGGDGGSGGRGGGVDGESASLSLSGCLFSANQAGTGGTGGLAGKGGEGGAGAEGGVGGMAGIGGAGGVGGPGGEGGGLWGYGSITISDSTFSHNESGDGAPGQHGGEGGLGGRGGDKAGAAAGRGGRGGDGGAGGRGADGGSGGAILVWSTLTMTLTTVDLNGTGAGGQGGNGGPGGTGGDGGNGNPAGDGYIGGVGGLGAPGGNGGDGGGIWSSLNAGEQVTIKQSSIEENATGGGGAGGHGGNGGNSGAAGSGLNPGESLSNGHGRNGGPGGRGGDGGGLWIQVGGEAKVTASTLYLNTTGDGGRGGDGGDSGANEDSDKGLGRDGADGGQGGLGGGILVAEYALPEPLLVENTTIHDNGTGAGGDGGDGGTGVEANGEAGDGGDGGHGGAVADYEEATLVSLTITNNGAAQGGKGGLADTSGTDGLQGDGGGLWITGTLSLGHSILDSNYGHGLNCYGTIDSLDYNRIKDIGSWCTLTGLTAHVYEGYTSMNSLGDHGGPTQTRALPYNSQAIDAGAANCKDASDQVQTADQRGFQRPVDGNGDTNSYCDIGAVEMQGFHTMSIALAGEGIGQVKSEPRVISCSGSAGLCEEQIEAGTAFTLTAEAGTGWDFVGWDGDCSGQDPTCPLVMDASKWVTATFDLEPEPEPDEWMVYLPIVLKGK